MRAEGGRGEGGRRLADFGATTGRRRRWPAGRAAAAATGAVLQ